MGQSLSGIGANLAQLGADMDAADFTTPGNYWQNQINNVFSNAQSDVIDAAVVTEKLFLEGAFSALDTGIEMRVAVSNPAKQKYDEMEALIKDGIEDFKNKFPLIAALRLDVPNSATIRGAFIQSASDGNLGDLRDNITNAVTHIGLILPVDFTGPNDNRVTGSIGASASRFGNAQTMQVRAGLKIRHLKVGVINGEFEISAGYIDHKNVNDGTHSILTSEGGFLDVRLTILPF